MAEPTQPIVPSGAVTLSRDSSPFVLSTRAAEAATSLLSLTAESAVTPCHQHIISPQRPRTMAQNLRPRHQEERGKRGTAAEASGAAQRRAQDKEQSNAAGGQSVELPFEEPQNPKKPEMQNASEPSGSQPPPTHDIMDVSELEELDIPSEVVAGMNVQDNAMTSESSESEGSDACSGTESESPVEESPSDSSGDAYVPSETEGTDSEDLTGVEEEEWDDLFPIFPYAENPPPCTEDTLVLRDRLNAMQRPRQALPGKDRLSPFHKTHVITNDDDLPEFRKMTDQWRKDYIGFIMCLIQRRIPLKNKEKHAGKIDKRIIAVEHHLFPMQDAASVERCILSIDKAKEMEQNWDAQHPGRPIKPARPIPLRKMVTALYQNVMGPNAPLYEEDIPATQAAAGGPKEDSPLPLRCKGNKGPIAKSPRSVISVDRDATVPVERVKKTTRTDTELVRETPVPDSADAPPRKKKRKDRQRQDVSLPRKQLVAHAAEADTEQPPSRKKKKLLAPVELATIDPEELYPPARGPLRRRYDDDDPDNDDQAVVFTDITLGVK
ncbi:hypothetical protein KFL_005690065 [Klebsormidium nitens]|uniref:Uncharacterized protein n=1 Tax=Klebsormidium nitens TaxID=105231 RepID=A0A1Y1IIG0_KLENI|nr:hypothetical protein KFL_005690065 [Klebsormidium nitens]|eukprot:GAQ89852.1 hypothetical protein KFL_005690065 [Klebsormidium nitens]